MADKFIQMSQRNAGNTDWDNLFPVRKFETAGGTATAITVTIPNLIDGVSKTFVAKSNNSGSSTTINGKNLYKPNTTTAPTLIAGKAYTVWYSSTSDCFFIKASATGTVTSDKVLAEETYSTEDDTDLVGTMPNNGAITITPGTTDQAIPAGYHNGQGKVIGVPIASGTGTASTSGLTGTASIRNLNFRPRAVTVMWSVNSVEYSVVYIPGGRNNIMQPSSNSGGNNPTTIIWDIFSDGFSVSSTNTNLLGNHDFNWIALL